MTEGRTDLSGYWKGVVVTRLFQVTIQIFVEQTGNELKARFEAYEPQGRSRSGSLAGTLDGDRIVLKADNNTSFTGQLTGTTQVDHMISGVIQGPNDESPTGTLTLFSAQSEIVLAHYQA
jgi:hypothetical protein